MPAAKKATSLAAVTPLRGAEPTGDLPRLVKSWERSLRARNLSPRTVDSYLDGAHQFVAFLAEHGYPTDAATVTRDHIEEFLDGLLRRWTASTAHTRHRALVQLFKFLEDELEVIDRSPMAKMRPPALVEKEIPIITEEQMRALLATCAGKTFEERRDNAMLRLFVDTGMRRAEMAGLRLEDLDLDNRIAYVMGKGRRPRACPFGNKTAVALDRYLLSRNKHHAHAEPWLWVGTKGRFGETGVAQMLRRRGRMVGIERLHPHQFRHSFAHQWLSSGGNEGDLMLLVGWRSRQMLQRYGRSAAAERARDAYRRNSPGDRL